MTKVYIDADYLPHRFTWNRTKEEGRADTRDHLDSILAELWADELVLILAGKDNFRKVIYPSYKANRPAMEQEKKDLFAEYKEWLMGQYPYEIADGQEADDLCAIRVMAHDDAVLVSPDKDMMTVPCKIFNPQKWILHDVSEDEADYNLHLQIIQGDRSDNIIGVPGYGPVKAKKALGDKPLGKRLSRVKAVYRANALSKEYLQLQTDLIYIRQSEEDRYIV